MSGKIDPTDIVGKKIGKVKVLKLLPDKKVYKNSKRYQYECLCECGNTTIKTRDSLIEKNANPQCEECLKE